MDLYLEDHHHQSPPHQGDSVDHHPHLVLPPLPLVLFSLKDALSDFLFRVGRHAAWLQAYCKVSCWAEPQVQIRPFRRSRTICTHSTRCVYVCVRARIAACIRQSKLPYELMPKEFPHISVNFHNFHKNSAPSTGSVETIFRNCP